MAKTISTILGIVFLLVGLLGFAAPNLMGMHLSTTHNLIHLVSGALALYFGLKGTWECSSHILPDIWDCVRAARHCRVSLWWTRPHAEYYSKSTGADDAGSFGSYYSRGVVHHRRLVPPGDGTNTYPEPVLESCRNHYKPAAKTAGFIRFGDKTLF